MTFKPSICPHCSKPTTWVNVVLSDSQIPALECQECGEYIYSHESLERLTETSREVKTDD
jgi:uncharacterized Zn finger protein